MGNEFAVAALVLIGLPWLILHYVTRWKTASSLTDEDEAMLEQLYQYARKLDERMDTIERIVAAEHPDFQPRGSTSRQSKINDEIDATSLDTWKRQSSKGTVK